MNLRLEMGGLSVDDAAAGAPLSDYADGPQQDRTRISRQQPVLSFGAGRSATVTGIRTTVSTFRFTSLPRFGWGA
jgi:hypothetical protein